MNQGECGLGLHLLQLRPQKSGTSMDNLHEIIVKLTNVVENR